MRVHLDRRRIVQLAAAAAVAPIVVSAQARATQAENARRISPPTGYMRYCRALERDLSYGARISIERTFEVRFIELGSGFRILGQQSDVDVSLPDGLDEFAQLERSRDESGLFPIDLTHDGRIMDWHKARTTESVDAALLAAQKQLSAYRFESPDARESLLDLAQAVHDAGSRIVTLMPLDLFAPAILQDRTEHDLALPTGGWGQIVSEFFAERDSTTGLMQIATREITTSIDNDRRVTREEWRLDIV